MTPLGLFGSSRPRAADEAMDTQILAALQAGLGEVQLPSTDGDAVVASYRRVLLRHPELFWVGPGCTTVRQGALGGRIRLQPAISGTPSQIRLQRERLESAVSAILARVPGIWPPYKKAIVLHDYLVEHTSYDKAVAASIDRDPTRMRAPSASTAYGCLVEHRAVCAGYACAYQLLLERAGIDCLRVKGQSVSGGGHEWNCVCLDGKWANVDVTWDDPGVDGSSEELLSHAFFCVPDAELRETHRPDPGSQLPACVSPELDYFRLRGQYLLRYDAAQVAKHLAKLRQGESLELKFGSPQERQRAVDALFTRKEIFKMRGAFGQIRRYQCLTGRNKRVLRMTVW